MLCLQNTKTYCHKLPVCPNPGEILCGRGGISLVWDLLWKQNVFCFFKIIMIILKSYRSLK